MAEPDPKPALEDAVLGETKGAYRLSTRAEVYTAALALLLQARRSLRLFSYDLDSAVLADDLVANAASELARRNRHTFIRFLVQDPRPAARIQHPLIRIIQSLPSHIGARRAAAEWAGESCVVLIVDDQGLLYRPDHDRFDGTVEFSARATAARYRDWFDDIWERSTPEPEFRRLRL